MNKGTTSGRIVLCTAVLLCAVMSVANASVSVSPLFSNHMVVQRDKTVPVYGTASPSENVTVTFNGQSPSTTADSQGNWKVALTPMSANKVAQSMTIQGANTITITDVLIGDVWVCSGQSNMAFGLGGCNRQTQDVNTANFPGIRHFWAPLVTSDVPLKSLVGNWTVCSPSTAAGFSAVAFYFGRKIYQDQGGDIPIGLIASTVGGTCIDPWLAPEGPLGIPVLNPLYSQNILPWGPFSLFNGMIYPLAPYQVKGAIWYQGENRETTNQSVDSYFLKKKALVQGWKSLWGGDEYAFYYVQIANWLSAPTSPTPETGATWPDTRLQQTNGLAIPHSGMAVTIDVGDAVDIHPQDKLDVGERLALWALKNDYGRTTVVPSGPILNNVVVGGSELVCSFDYVGSGLMVGSKTPYLPTAEVPGGTLQMFSIAGAGGPWYWANATIVGDTVVVSSPSVASPRKIAYAYWINPAGANLYNRDGLPASPFYVDDVNAKYTINASAGAGGSISPSGTKTLLKRTTALYTITPDPSYYIEDVLVDSVSVGAVKYYTFDPVYANHTISATFTAIKPTYTVGATAGPGGSISPSGSVVVSQGDAGAFTIAPNPGGRMAPLLVDTKPMGARSDFTFGDVRADHSIYASFTCLINASAGYGGTITPSGTRVIDYGADQTFDVAVLPGFSIYAVVVDGTNVGAVTSYTFNDVVENHEITVTFVGSGGPGAIPRADQLIFACLSDSLPASGAIGSWPTYYPVGQSLTPIGTPVVETLSGRKWERNIYTDYDGFRFGASYGSAISCTGATIVVAAKPIRGTDSGNWRSIVDVFYDRLVFGLMNDTGQACVRRNGSWDFSTPTVPEGQTTVLSLVVQPGGSFKVWANGIQIMNVTTSNPEHAMNSLVPGVTGGPAPGGFGTYINVGRNNPDGWTTFNGNIGDVFLYKTALSDVERGELESYVAYKLTGCVIEASSTGDGTISPEGTVLVPYDGEQTFTITPAEGGTVQDVLVDDVSIGAVTEHTFSNVTENHTIRASFSSGSQSGVVNWLLY